MEQSKRIGWIDMAKGWGLICVVVGHLGAPVIGRFITSFHMPLFFFLSGLTFSADMEFLPFLRKKAKRLLVPYFTLGIPLVASSFVTRYVAGIRDPKEYLHVIVKFLVQERMFTLWFIACLFFLSLIFWCIIRLTRNRLVPVGIIAALMGIVGLLFYQFGVWYRLPWNIDICFTAAPYFCIGYLLKQTGYSKKEKAFTSWTGFAVAAVIYFVGVEINWRLTGDKLSMALNQYCIAPLSFLTALCGIYCVLVFSRRFSKIPVVEYLGRNSMIYFVWHQSIVQPLLFVAYGWIGIFQSGSLLSDGIRFVVTSVLSFLVLYPFDLLFRKTRLRVCVGQPNPPAGEKIAQRSSV